MTQHLGAHSTTDEVLNGIDLSGKRVLVTGASAGLGVETVRTLVAHGAEVVGTARDVDKARRATAAVERGTKSGSLEIRQMDLAALGSVRACADALLAEGKPFDVVINNAGVMACPPGKTQEGFELQFGTNHLGHFVFANRIAPMMREGGRLVSLASAGHHFADVDLDDPNFDYTDYDPFVAYGRSKTANVLFAAEFDQRHAASGIRAVAVHPGVIHTELGRHLPQGAMDALIGSLKREAAAASDVPFAAKSVAQGAATSVWAGIVAAPEAVGGLYCEDCGLADFIGPEGAVLLRGVRDYALDAERAKALWAKSEEMVGEQF